MRTNKRTIAYWIKHFGYTIEWWNTSSKFGLQSLGFQVYGPDMSTHTFYF